MKTTVRGLFYKFAPLSLLFDQLTRGREFHFHFDHLLPLPVLGDFLDHETLLCMSGFQLVELTDRLQP